MNWIDIKNSIRQDLLNRGLSNPKIRLNALEKVEEIMKLNLQEYIDKPEEKFRKTDKQEFKKLVAKHKHNKKLNSAESSVINEIYYRIEGTVNIRQDKSRVFVSDGNKKELLKETCNNQEELNISPEKIKKNTTIFIVVSSILVLSMLYLMFRKEEKFQPSKKSKITQVESIETKQEEVSPFSEITLGEYSDSLIRTMNFYSETVNYSIISKKCIHKVKCSFDIRLSEKVSKKELKKIALNIKNSLDKEYQRIFIVYYLPRGVVGSGGWAISHFNPDLEVKILGSTIEEDQATIKSRKKTQYESVIGKWTDSYNGCILTLLKKNNTFYLDKAYESGSYQIELEVRMRNNKKRYYPVENDFDEYYYINRSKNLEVYDYQGYIETYFKR